MLLTKDFKRIVESWCMDYMHPLRRDEMNALIERLSAETEIHSERPGPKVAEILEVQAGKSFVIATVQGQTADDCQQGLLEYFKRYPIMGYSTSIVEQPEHRLDGKWYCSIKRYASCD